MKLPDPEAGGPLSRLFRGVGYVVRGQRSAFAEPSLRMVSLVATLWAALFYTGPLALLSAGLFFLEWELHPHWTLEALHGTAGETAVEGGKLLVVGLAIVVYAVLGFLLSVIVGRLMLGWYCDTLAERTEALLTGREAERVSFLGALWSSILEMGVQVTLLAFHVPVLVGVALIAWYSHPAALVLGWLWTSLWLTLSFTSSVCRSHRVGALARMGIISKHALLSVGFGAIPALVMPILVPILLPGMVVGGTKLYLSLAAHDEAPCDFTDEEKDRMRQ